MQDCILRPRGGSNDAVTVRVDRPLVLGLRGTTGVHAPNTPQALSAALAEGAEGIVVDVDVTSDGVAVACDDRWLRAFGGGLTRVASVTAQALGELGVMTVAEVMARFAARGIVGLWVHPHADARTADDRFGIVGAALDGANAWVIGSDVDALARLGVTRPNVRCFLRDPRPEAGALVAGVGGLCRPVRLGPPPAWTRGPDTLVLGTDCDTPAALRRALAGGFDALVSERPGWLSVRIGSARPVAS